MEWSLRPDCVHEDFMGSTADADAEIIESHLNNAPHISIYAGSVAGGHFYLFKTDIFLSKYDTQCLKCYADDKYNMLLW